MSLSDRCIIISNWEYGAGRPGTSKGPQGLLDVCTNSQIPFTKGLNVFSVLQKIEEKDNIPLPEFLKRGNAFLNHQKHVCETVSNCLESYDKILYLSGDHSNAVGSLAGFCQKFGAQNLGVVWMDAHLDLHSPYTTPSGNIHGMALNASLNLDNREHQINPVDPETSQLWENIKSIKGSAGIPAKNIVMIGIRDYETPEIELARNSGITIITVNEVIENGIDWVISTVNSKLSHLQNWYFSFDVDSLDPSISVGTGTPVSNGFSFETASQIFKTLAEHPKTTGLEITEINPDLEESNAMTEAAAKLLSLL